MEKIAFFVFNGDPMCFIHVLLNALEMAEKGKKVQIVIEGASTKLLPDLSRKENALHDLWQKVKEKELVAGVCKACSSKTGTLDSAKEQHLAVLDEMKGHPSIARYQDEGYAVITF
jgi:hypothetical protein